MTDKPKRKNLSPDELLQQAKLLHPENEAFVRGETKNLPHRAELLANLYSQVGFPTSDDILRSTHRNRILDFGFMLLAGSMYLCGGLFSLFAVVVSSTEGFHGWRVCYGVIILPLGLLLTYLGLGAIISIWNMVITSEKNINRRIASLVQEGKLIIGTRIHDGEGRLMSKGRYSQSFDLSYISPKYGKIRRISWVL